MLTDKEIERLEGRIRRAAGRLNTAKHGATEQYRVEVRRAIGEEVLGIDSADMVEHRLSAVIDIDNPEPLVIEEGAIRAALKGGK